MIEAELKARVRDVGAVAWRLARLAPGRGAVYRDTYYDTSDRALEARGAELRVRTVGGDGGTRTVLTYKGAVVDEVSGSRPEHESGVADPDAVHAMLRGLGYGPVIAFEKHCRNHEFTARGRTMLATLVRVPELDGTFLEVEALVEPEELADALADVRAVLADLGIGEGDLTRELYTDAVRARRDA
ncbi:class IV adenylate cyclase [Streptomyces sp. BI20]|uniref:class IV adenylate cyclase n=1 Tax=Streptomyces sp. BI20 TaxID=3403460 RepID=UPI003C72553C